MDEITAAWAASKKVGRWDGLDGRSIREENDLSEDADAREKETLIVCRA